MSQQIIPIGQIQKDLRFFKLSGMAESLDIRIKQATDDSLGYTEFLGMLLEDEINRRSDNKKKRLYHGAKLPFEKGIEDFDFTFQPSIKKQEIIELSTCHFLEKKANIILIGQPGTGKTHLSVAIALSALGRSKTVFFTTVWEMINILQQSRADYSYQKKIQMYLKPDLLILDELGYRSMAESTVEDFFEIVSKRYEKGSIIVTSNKPMHLWDSVFIDKTLTTAVVDRLMHHCSVIEIKGESYRFKKRD
ncbi:MAG: IS21-like element helper ATPase IstB [Candidatus Nomurabacteria bacterium]|nr:IS21-like element helper ATPase IstB [Candidatus Nomurabacteria bacterium]